MGILLINYASRFAATIWAFCSAFLIASDWFIYIEPFGKLLVLILGLVAGLVMTSIAFTKRKQAEAEYKTAQLKYEEEKIKHRKDVLKEEREENYNLDFDELS